MPKQLTVTTVSRTERGEFILSYALHRIRNFIYREHSTLIIQNLVPLKGDLTTLRYHLVQNANSAWVERWKISLKDVATEE